jgi:hypothetical protein
MTLTDLRAPAFRTALALLVLAGISAEAPASSAAQTADDVQVGRFDFGKMWTFEYPPADYFSETYGFDATAEWFERARMAALRIPGCSAAFVSADGLVVTNHHCARRAISAASRQDESLLDDGFYATSLEDERPLPGTYADQLVAVADVTDEILLAVDAAPEADRGSARDEAVEAVRRRMAAEHAGTDGVFVQVVPLYNGGRYSAYVFRRFTDVRLVAAAELNLGFFGGDPDNFTYPRYALDFAFYRVYGAEGRPYRPTHWFSWGDGAGEGEPVFIIGNPGPTNRLRTVAQLEYQRDVYAPVRKSYFETRLRALHEAYAQDPVEGERLDLRNRAFSLSNSLKAYTGRLDALRDGRIMARKRAAEEAFGEALAADAELAERFGDVVGAIAGLQAELRGVQAEHGAFYNLGNATYGSRALMRALTLTEMRAAQRGGAPADSVAPLRARLLAIPDHPAGLEEDLLGLRLSDFERYLPDGDPLLEAALGGRSPEGAAARMVASSLLARRSALQSALDTDGVAADDALLTLAGVLAPRVAAYQRHAGTLAARERELGAELGRARFEVYGTAVAPDATSSPRITDGVVQGYEYNGTLAPAHTTFYGMYDRYYSHEGDVEWQLPDRWAPPPSGLDLSTPLNFTSTADTYGGNSGSPAVTRDLEIVGLNFDRNIEGLSRDFIYLPERGRNIMVDVRAIREALEEVYGAARIVEEIMSGRAVRQD